MLQLALFLITFFSSLLLIHSFLPFLPRQLHNFLFLLILLLPFPCSKFPLFLGFLPFVKLIQLAQPSPPIFIPQLFSIFTLLETLFNWFDLDQECSVISISHSHLKIVTISLALRSFPQAGLLMTVFIILHFTVKLYFQVQTMTFQLPLPHQTFYHTFFSFNLLMKRCFLFTLSFTPFQSSTIPLFFIRLIMVHSHAFFLLKYSHFILPHFSLLFIII